MRIDRLEVRNFKKFADASFDFPFPSGLDRGRHQGIGSFHVLIGENGSGKTSILDALAVALGVWLVKVPDSSLTNSRRPLLAEQKRMLAVVEGDRAQIRESAGDLSIRAVGSILGHKQLTWGQSLRAGQRNVSNAESKKAIQVVASAYEEVARGTQVLLPVIAYYGAGRTWLPHNQRQQLKARANGLANRWHAFYDCLNDRIRLSDLSHWFRSEAIARGNRGGRYRPGFDVVLKAVQGVVPEADELIYDSDREQICLSIAGNLQPLSNLSAGQRSLFALVADLAIKMVTQNNFLVPPDVLDAERQNPPRVLTQTPGVVLIDELDVHLHPRWQRTVVEHLRKTFPAIQFITTTHSPFIVQSLRGDELINLEGQSIPELGNQGVESIARGLMGVDRPDVGERYEEMVMAAKDYLVILDEAAQAPAEKLADFESKLAARIAPYADNPAFQAFLELKHAAKLGSNGLSARTELLPKD